MRRSVCLKILVRVRVSLPKYVKTHHFVAGLRFRMPLGAPGYVIGYGAVCVCVLVWGNRYYVVCCGLYFLLVDVLCFVVGRNLVYCREI